MPDRDDRLVEIEIALAHQQRVLEELSDVIRTQADRLERLVRVAEALGRRLAALEDGTGAPPPADRRPPHW